MPRAQHASVEEAGGVDERAHAALEHECDPAVFVGGLRRKQQHSADCDVGAAAPRLADGSVPGPLVRAELKASESGPRYSYRAHGEHASFWDYAAEADVAIFVLSAVDEAPGDVHPPPPVRRVWAAVPLRRAVFGAMVPGYCKTGDTNLDLPQPGATLALPSFRVTEAQFRAIFAAYLYLTPARHA